MHSERFNEPQFKELAKLAKIFADNEHDKKQLHADCEREVRGLEDRIKHFSTSSRIGVEKQIRIDSKMLKRHRCFLASRTKA
jgi:hypothetical protein